MIRIYGTSHVSRDSLDVIDEAMETDPDIVALELDENRLQALMSDKKSNPDTFFLKFLQTVQNKIGEKTGLMPGKELLYAHDKAFENGSDVALIDRNIRETFARLKSVRRKEKVKAAASMILGLLVPFGGLNISEIPEEEQIDRLVEELQKSYPCIYRVLMEERNNLMALKIAELQRRNPEASIAVFVGAAHKKPVEHILEAEGFAVGSQSSLAQFE
ncbi:TraB/GumN family protein [Candidatus Nanosalina sp. VS9-1]|uniref:TraB/GumN family protein n=1 Tax=Candidatus Nanosalina sp. VS9-1 TaxID=3388566 RepID=UPI0039E07D22